jgi:hypothetical protein
MLLEIQFSRNLPNRILPRKPLTWSSLLSKIILNCAEGVSH